ncbi:head-tail joining protein [Burkholderia sp. TSV86]|uniref:head-tail joining protein n=1 Tax=Burkholderia sp. TSV86 TaxID=1385594 RepID=UPI0007525683|nr:hypothetical protein [Burkholderia sp. TSV86]KVE35261.1 hypothetical protein WS68_07635 [Burkholderia sp. TSV86]
MPHPAWDDPAEFLDLDEFAVKAVIQFQNGETREIVGIYDGPYREAQLGEYEQDTTKPKFTCMEGVARGARRGDGLVVYEADGVSVFGTFNIMTYPQPDGTGLEVLELTQA